MVVNVDYVASTHGISGLDPARFTAQDLEPRFSVIALQRFIEKTYRDVLYFIAEIVLKNERMLPRGVEVLAGINDVGMSIDYLLEGLDISPALYVISGASATSSYTDNVYTVSRGELVASLVSAYGTHMVQYAPGMENLTLLKSQLTNLQTRRDTGSRVTRDTEEGLDDDLALALAMCIWMGRQDHKRDKTYLDRLKSEGPQERGYDPNEYALNRGSKHGNR